MRLPDYTNRKDHNSLHNMDHMGIRIRMGIHNRIRNRIHNRMGIRVHNTNLPKNDDRGDKILVAYFCIYLTLLTKLLASFYPKFILLYL